MTDFQSIAIESFDNRADLYRTYPQLEAGWDDPTNQSSAPWGIDLQFGDDWIVTFCVPSAELGHPDKPGVVTACYIPTDEVFVLAVGVELEEARVRWPLGVRP